MVSVETLTEYQQSLESRRLIVYREMLAVEDYGGVCGME